VPPGHVTAKPHHAVRQSGALRPVTLECMVARLLGARFPLLGTSPWDLILLDGTRIEVRSGTLSFSLGGKKDVHVWVFVHKLVADAPFSVTSTKDVAAFGLSSVAASKLAVRSGRVTAAELAANVEAVSSGRRASGSKR
jgi:hypothetical protein